MSVRRRLFVSVIFALIVAALSLVVILFINALRAISELEEEQPQADDTQVLLPAELTSD